MTSRALGIGALLLLTVAGVARAEDAAWVRRQVAERTNAGLRALRRGEARRAADLLCWAADRLLNGADVAWFCGRALLAAHEAPRAVGYLERAVELDPRNLGARVDLGEAYLAAGRPDEARAAFFAALEVRPDHSPALDGLARVAEATGNEERALELFALALRANPADAAARLHRGQLHLAAGRVDQALEDIEEAARLRPDDGLVQLGLAQVTAAAGLADRALSAARRAAELLPGDARPAALVAAALLDLGAPEEAEAQARRALSLDPDLPQARISLAEVLGRTGRLEEAVAILERSPAPWWSERDRSAVEEARRRWTERREALARLTEAAASPDADPATLLALAEAELAAGRRADASRHAARAAERSGEPDLLRRAAYVLGSAGRPLEAERLLSRIAEGGLAGPRDLVNIGVARELSGDPEGAGEAYRRALDAGAGGDAKRAALAGLARLALRGGDVSEAGRLLRAFLAAGPERREALRVQAALRALEAAAEAPGP
ncbi:MAG: hypothetical protein D6718_03075 [Acidobacteria bacterium]|nr:MAG: hypothetical protein D6718_03075 [Acidobacteriota bacterium]